MIRASSTSSSTAVDDVLRPIIRLLKASGISDSEIISVVRARCRAYRSESVTGSWLGNADVMQLPEILSLWMHDQEFVGSTGAPCKLNLSPEVPSFRQLVAKAGVTIPPRHALKQLEALGAVQICDKGRKVRLVSNVLFSVSGRRFLSAPSIVAIRWLAESIEHNVLDRPGVLEGRMQRSAFLSVDPKQLPEIERFVRLSGQAFLDTIDQKLRLCSKRSRTGSEPRYGVGVYAFIDRPSRAKRR